VCGERWLAFAGHTSSLPAVYLAPRQRALHRRPTHGLFGPASAGRTSETYPRSIWPRVSGPYVDRRYGLFGPISVDRVPNNSGGLLSPLLLLDTCVLSRRTSDPPYIDRRSLTRRALHADIDQRSADRSSGGVPRQSAAK